MRKRWPALIVPDYMEGVFTLNAGVIRVKNAFQQFKDQSIEQGAVLKYSTNVTHIDHSKGEVTLENGDKVVGKQVVVTCGATTD